MKLLIDACLRNFPLVLWYVFGLLKTYLLTFKYANGISVVIQEHVLIFWMTKFCEEMKRCFLFHFLCVLWEVKRVSLLLVPGANIISIEHTIVKLLTTRNTPKELIMLHIQDFIIASIFLPWLLFALQLFEQIYCPQMKRKKKFAIQILTALVNWQSHQPNTKHMHSKYFVELRKGAISS